MEKKPKTIKALVKYLSLPDHKYLKVDSHTTGEYLTDSAYGRMEVTSVTQNTLFLLMNGNQPTNIPFVNTEFTDNGFQVHETGRKTTFAFEYLPLDTDVLPIRHATVTDIAIRHIRQRGKHSDEFLATFGVPISQFWGSNLLGFDILGFETWLKTPEDVCVSTHIASVYNNRAAEIVRELLSTED